MVTSYGNYDWYEEFLDGDESEYFSRYKATYESGHSQDEVSMSQEAMWTLLEKAERMGREAARRDLIDAITEAGAKKRGSISAEVRIRYDHERDAITTRSNYIDDLRRDVLAPETDKSIVTKPDSDFNLRNKTQVESALPEYLKDEEDPSIGSIYTNGDKNPVTEAQEKLEVGWYQRGTELIYWDGEAWGANPQAAKTLGTKTLSLMEIEKLEYVG